MVNIEEYFYVISFSSLLRAWAGNMAQWEKEPATESDSLTTQV